MSKILVVDDDKNLLEVLSYNLVKESYTVITAEDGVQALEMARRHKPDLTILDIMLPGLDGLEVCRIMRDEIDSPILMLTAKAEEIDKIVGLELGADDYMTKPFSIRELMARIRAMLRRSQRKERQTQVSIVEIPSMLKVGNLEIDTTGHRVSRNGSVLSLSPKEFDLLSFLVHNRGQVFSRDTLVERIWGHQYEGNGRTVDVHVRWLRRKIEDDPQKPEHLLTVHGFGYKFE